MKADRWFNILCLTGLVACVALPVAILCCPPVLSAYLQDGSIMEVWRTRTIWLMRWGLVFLSLVIPLITCVFARMAGNRYNCFIPVVALPLIVPPMLFPASIPVGLLSNIVFFLPVAVVSSVLLRVVGKFSSLSYKSGSPAKYAALLFVVTSVVFACMGVYVTDTIGPHIGDEAHYYTIARSLREDGSLDLKQVMIRKFTKDDGTLPDADLMKDIRRNMHLSPNARDGHWYSTHSFGLSLLLAPFERGNEFVGRHIALGVIAGAGCAGLFLLCSCVCNMNLTVIFGAVLLFGLSQIWSGYAVRSLPEVLGATLTVWAFWGVFDQKKHPVSSLLVVALCCGYMPWAHVRYIPVSLLCVGFFGLAGLIEKRFTRDNILRLGAFSLLCIAAYVGYYAFQSSLFEGGCAYSGKGKSLVYFPGAWYSISDTRGLMHIFPVFIWLFVAQIVLFVKEKSSRLFVASVFVVFFFELILACSNDAWTNGSSLPGKKLLVVLPIFVPAALFMLRRVSNAARFLLIFLGVISVGYTLAMLVGLKFLGGEFCRGPLALAKFHPLLLNMLDSHAGCGSLRFGLARHIVANVWAVSSFVLCLILLILDKKRIKSGWSIVAILGVTAVASHLFVHEHKKDIAVSPGWVKHNLSQLDFNRLWIPKPVGDSTTRLSDVISGSPTRIMSVTTKDLGKRVLVEPERRTISLPNIEVNDWEERGYRWATLADPFRPEAGMKMITIRAQMEGDAVPVFALREGSVTTVEHTLVVGNDGAIDTSFVFNCDGGRGDLYVLVRLEGGEGTFVGKCMIWSIGSRRFIEQSGVIPPDDIVYVNSD